MISLVSDAKLFPRANYSRLACTKENRSPLYPCSFPSHVEATGV
jgi:hypothetical protein